MAAKAVLVAQVIDPVPGQHALEWSGLSADAAAQPGYRQGGRSRHPREPHRGSWKNRGSPVHPRGCTAKCDELSCGLGRWVASGRVPWLPASTRKGWGPGQGACPSSQDVSLCSAGLQPELGQGQRLRSRAGRAVEIWILAGVVTRQTRQRWQKLWDFICK